MSPIDGLQFTLTNIFQLISFLSPFFLGFFLVLGSIFNQDLKGLIYLAGVLMATIINILLLNIIRSTSLQDRSPICDLVSMNIFNTGGTFDNPNLSSSFISFTMVYLILPMIYNKQMNWVVLVFLFLLYIIDILTVLSNKCSRFPGILTGTITGIILGSLWYSVINVTGNSKLLYFDEFISNNVVCSRPSKQTFKCSVYKNGELIKNNIV